MRQDPATVVQPSERIGTLTAVSFGDQEGCIVVGAPFDDISVISLWARSEQKNFTCGRVPSGALGEGKYDT